MRTWEGPGGQNWIVDSNFLPAVLPKARIMTFGYNANLFDDVVTSQVVDHSTTLLASLLALRADCIVRVSILDD